MSASGIYTWSYAGGSFEVALRPLAGVFFCEKFMSAATYTTSGDELAVDWKKFGKYSFRKTSSSPVTFDGSADGNESNWRKMEFKRDFSPMELALFGEAGLGTVWNFAYEGGEFEVQFMTDGYNHFNCPKFPAHSHWKNTSESQLEVNWGKYGDYILNFVDPSHLSGHKKGSETNWRRCTLIRSITTADKSESANAHAHDH